MPCDCQTGSQVAESTPVDQTVESSPVDYAEESSTQWTDWSPWGACNRSCGDGQQTRVRTCQGGAIGTGNCHANNWKGTRIYCVIEYYVILFRSEKVQSKRLSRLGQLGCLVRM